jgi:hypothetical protein
MKELLLLLSFLFAGVIIDANTETKAVIPSEIELAECENCDEID